MNSFDLFGNPTERTALGNDPRYHRPGFHLPNHELEAAVEDDQRPQPNLRGVAAVSLACAAVLGIQCFRLQVTEGSANRAAAVGNSIRLITVQADRGLITDDAGTVLAQNSRQLALAVDPLTLPARKADRQAVYATLQAKAGIDPKTIDFIETTGRLQQERFAIKTNLSKDESLLYKEEFAEVPGITLEEVPVRTYAQFPSMGQLIGYVGAADVRDVQAGAKADDRVGKAGLEEQYDSALKGTPGIQKAEVNAYGEVVRQLSSGAGSQPVAGQTLKLSIDLKLQQIVATALQNELARRTAKYGKMDDMGASAVVMDPNTGAIKAMVSLPDYDGNLFAQGISAKDYSSLLSDPGHPLLNRAIQGTYPSGSVIKPLIAAEALQRGIITPDKQFVTPAAIFVGQFRFPDWKTHGLTNIRKSIAESNDITFYALGGGWKDQNITGLGIDGLNAGLAKFGLGSPTGIDIPGEASGLLPTPDWKEKTIGEPWYIGDTYHSAIGQGYTLVTPLQMAAATAAIANGGTLWQPSLAWSTIDAKGKETVLPHPALNKDWISSANLQVVRDGMRMTVTSGSATPLNKLQVQSAGKTGTAEFGANNEYEHAWYTGYAPYDKPQIAFAIMIEAGGESFYSSEPVAEEILRGYFNEPLQPGQKLFSSTDVPQGYEGEH